MAVIAGRLGPLQHAGVPGVGVSEVQTVTVTGIPTAGTFKLSFMGYVSGALAHNISSANLQVALRLLPSIGATGVTVAGDAPHVVTFAGNLARKVVPLLVLVDNLLTGGTAPSVTVVETTAGVDATHRGQGKGAVVIDTTNGKAYINTGTAFIPIWTVMGAQT